MLISWIEDVYRNPTLQHWKYNDLLILLSLFQLIFLYLRSSLIYIALFNFRCLIYTTDLISFFSLAVLFQYLKFNVHKNLVRLWMVASSSPNHRWLFYFRNFKRYLLVFYIITYCCEYAKLCKLLLLLLLL